MYSWVKVDAAAPIAFIILVLSRFLKDIFCLQTFFLFFWVGSVCLFLGVSSLFFWLPPYPVLVKGFFLGKGRSEDGRVLGAGAVLRLGGAHLGGYGESDIAYAYRQVAMDRPVSSFGLAMGEVWLDLSDSEVGNQKQI